MIFRLFVRAFRSKVPALLVAFAFSSLNAAAGPARGESREIRDLRPTAEQSKVQANRAELATRTAARAAKTARHMISRLQEVIASDATETVALGSLLTTLQGSPSTTEQIQVAGKYLRLRTLLPEQHFSMTFAQIAEVIADNDTDELAALALELNAAVAVIEFALKETGTANGDAILTRIFKISSGFAVYFP